MRFVFGTIVPKLGDGLFEGKELARGFRNDRSGQSRSGARTGGASSEELNVDDLPRPYYLPEVAADRGLADTVLGVSGWVGGGWRNFAEAEQIDGRSSSSVQAW
jgi:hypothetical protein